jgi:hypothetical protein
MQDHLYFRRPPSLCQIFQAVFQKNAVRSQGDMRQFNAEGLLGLQQQEVVSDILESKVRDSGRAL